MQGAMQDAVTMLPTRLEEVHRNLTPHGTLYIVSHHTRTSSLPHIRIVQSTNIALSFLKASCFFEKSGFLIIGSDNTISQHLLNLYRTIGNGVCDKAFYHYGYYKRTPSGHDRRNAVLVVRKQLDVPLITTPLIGNILPHAIHMLIDLSSQKHIDSLPPKSLNLDAPQCAASSPYTSLTESPHPHFKHIMPSIHTPSIEPSTI